MLHESIVMKSDPSQFSFRPKVSGLGYTNWFSVAFLLLSIYCVTEAPSRLWIGVKFSLLWCAIFSTDENAPGTLHPLITAWSTMTKVMDKRIIKKFHAVCKLKKYTNYRIIQDESSRSVLVLVPAVQKNGRYSNLFSVPFQVEWINHTSND